MNVDDMVNAAIMSAPESEGKFKKFEKLLHTMGDELKLEGVCKSYTVDYLAGSKIPRIELNDKPTRIDQISHETYIRISNMYDELLHSCDITDEEYEGSYGGVFWELCDREVTK